MTVRTPQATHSTMLWGGIVIFVAVSGISVLHYLASLHSIVLHEIFQRLYYVPIVIAAVTVGTRGGLAASAYSTLLYLPHVALQWHAWPAVDAEQYGEVLMFNIVALVTGGLADRLHTQRQRYQDAATELADAHTALEAQAEEHQRIDRLATIGRITAGIAHEIRTPLASLLGSLEILGAEFPPAHRKAEFVEIAKREVSRLQGVVTEFLEFAEPAPPAAQALDLGLLGQLAARLARPALAYRGLDVYARASNAPVMVRADAEQLQRALLNIVLVSAPSLRDGHIVFTVRERDGIAQIMIELKGATILPAVNEIFEPFRTSGPGQGLGLATAARLIENQGGVVRADICDGRLQFVIDLPVARLGAPAELSSLSQSIGAR